MFIELRPETSVYKETAVTKSILGFPLEYSDTILNYLTVEG